MTMKPILSESGVSTARPQASRAVRERAGPAARLGPASSGPRTKLRSTAAIAAAVLAVFSTVPLAAQEEAPTTRRQTMHIRGAEVRDPEAMHNGPVVLMGIEDALPSFRSETPALDRAKKQPLQVDQDWLYRRKLRMFDDGGILHHDALPPMVAPSPMPHVMPTPETVAEGDKSVRMWLLTGATMLASAVAFVLWRKRHVRQVAAEIELPA